MMRKTPLGLVVFCFKNKGCRITLYFAFFKYIVPSFILLNHDNDSTGNALPANGSFYKLAYG